ncbi:hypothetical protein ULG90_06595 [Halopseudomonas pachastrellae]|nr:hypothetical protein UMZ34_24255 [Halopseudomonas pachastrellae]WVM93570.1 hypothetical protein ULG90_06595 [Halopseudomonas pachastrellae]
MNPIHQDDLQAIGNAHFTAHSRVGIALAHLQGDAYTTGVERGKEMAKQAAIEAGTISPARRQTIHLGQPGVTVEPCLMLGPADDEVACLLFTAPGTEVRLTWPTQTQALAVLAAATDDHCPEADAQPVTCECGDSYPPGSYGAGFIEGRGHCANCAAGSGEMVSLLGVSPAPVRRVEQNHDAIALEKARNIMQIMYGETPRGGSTQLLAMVQVCVLEAMSHVCTPQHAPTAVPLAAKHQGMRISAAGMLNRVGGRLQFGAREMLKHLEEMATRYYAGDIAAVDEFLQLYCLDEKRPEQRAAVESGGGER